MENINAGRFTDIADIYQQFRASYPKELVEYLYTVAGFAKNSVIADIGSGTGIFSRCLLERGSRVFCVEPNDDMRLIAEKELRDEAGFKRFISVKALAENTGLEKNSIDFITTAQAFHWFDRHKFKQECQRILKAGGKVVLIWNIRDQEHEAVKRDYIIRQKYSVGDAQGLGEGGGPPQDCADFFLGGVCEELTFRNDLLLGREAYIGMNLSRSYAPGKEKYPEKYHGFVLELGNLFDEYSVDGVLSYPHITKVFIGRV